MALIHLLVAILPLAGTAFAAPNSPATSLSRRSVKCLTVGATATATWTNSAGQTCTFKGTVGSNFGANAAGGDYACNGRCGAACDGTSVGNVYTQDCFTHDICSYFENSSTGASDPNCGTAYNNAQDDYLLGYADGCSQTNPSNLVAAPASSPSCS